MKVTYDRGLDPTATLAKIAGIHTPDLATIERRLVAAVEDRLVHLPKKDRTGARLSYTSAGVEARAYRYAVNGVRVTATLTTTAIRIMSIDRAACYPKSKERVQILLSAGQEAIVGKNAVSYAQASA